MISGQYILKILFSSRIGGFLRRSCSKLLECHKTPSQKSYAVFIRLTDLLRDYIDIYWGWSQQTKIEPFYCFFSAVQGRLVGVGYRPRHLDRCPKLTPNHCQRHPMLAHKHQTGTICTGLIWYLLVSPGSAHRTVMTVPECFVMLLKG